MATLAIGEENTTTASTSMTTTNPRNEKYSQIRSCLTPSSSSSSEEEREGKEKDSLPSLWELRELALTPGGLVNDELRQKIWPSLAGLNRDLKEDWLETTAQLVAAHTNNSSGQVCSEMEDRERDLIRRDVGRSVLFHHSCPSPNSIMDLNSTSDAAVGTTTTAAGGGGTDADTIKTTAEDSTSILALVLQCTVSTPLTTNLSASTTNSTTKARKPYYYQGLHDIAGVVLHNMDYHEVVTTAILRRMCHTHLRDFCKESFTDLQWFLDATLLPLLKLCDAQVHEALVVSGVPLLSTVLPWLLTWFTHSMHDEEGASRLVDAFLASHPLLPFYVSVALLVHPILRRDILTTELDDPSSMHFVIQQLPSRIHSDWINNSSSDGNEASLEIVTAQDLIETALSIMEQHPPQSLLQLVDEPERAECMGLMQSLKFWTLDQGGSTFKGDIQSSFDSSCPRAKMASGVPVLMTNPPEALVADWRKPFGPPLETPVPPKPSTVPVTTTKQRSPIRKLQRRMRNTLRQVRRRLPQSTGVLMVLLYFTCILLYGLYDWMHYTYLYYMAQLYLLAH